jgi:hypothetical protein
MTEVLKTSRKEYPMAKSISTGYTDTAISGFTSLPLTAPAVNYSEDYRILSEGPAEVILTNVKSPVDQPSTFRFAQRANKNVYAGLGVDPSAYLPIQQGTDTVVQVKELWSETDADDSTYRKLIPASCGITLSLPAYGSITEAQALALVLRTVAGLFEQKSSDGTGIAALLRGVLVKKGL